MTFTVYDIKQHIINKWTPLDFLEWFDIPIEDLVDMFEDFIIDDYDELAKEFEEEADLFNGSEES